MEKGEGIDIAKNYTIRAYPTLLYLDEKGEKLLVSVGANRDPQSYIENGKRALDPKNNIPYFLANKDANFDNPGFMSSYFSLMSEANMVEAEEVDRYFSKIPFEQWLNDANWGILMESPLAFENTTFQTILSNSGVVQEEKGPEAITFISDRIYQILGQQLYRARDEEGKEAYLNAKANFSKGNYIAKDEVVFKLSVLEYQKDKNWELWVETITNGVKKYYWDDANALNNVAWTAFENVEDQNSLKSALKWAKRAVELSQAHHIIDTYAHLLAATGEKEAALEQEMRALEIAQSQGASTDSYEKFIEELKD